MGCKFICDGCGKESKELHGFAGGWFSPNSWFERHDSDSGRQVTCSRDCIKKVSEKTGEKHPVAPF